MKRLIVAIGVIAILSLPATAASAILAGDYLRVGVSDSGGLIDDGFNVGIDFDITGTSTWTGYDFLMPGTPFEFFSVGYGGNYGTDGYYHKKYMGPGLGGTTSDTSAGSTNSAHTDTSFGVLAISQDLWYDDASGWIDFRVVLTNTSTSDTIREVVYARGLDPDQDVYAGGGYETDNEIPNGDLVFASAPVTDWTIGIFSDSAFPHVPTVDMYWSTDPSTLLTPHDDGDGDWTINMAWQLGTLEPGQSKTITFQYRIGEQRADVILPEPGSFALLGLGVAGLLFWRRKRS